MVGRTTRIVIKSFDCNKDKAVRRREWEATRRNGRRIIPSLTLKIVSGNEVVDLNNLGPRLPYVACALTQIITAKGLYELYWFSWLPG
jgi:hypothetical protein